MKLNLKILIMILFSIISCDDGSNNFQDLQSFHIESEKGFDKYEVHDFLSEILLIGKEEKLNGFKSLNIAGHRLYEFDGAGKIIARYDISNNYSVYSYDKKNRLIKFENKQHNPPEIYNEIEFQYSDVDSVKRTISISYEKNEPINKEIVTDNINLDAEKVWSMVFKNEMNNDFFYNDQKQELITFKD